MKKSSEQLLLSEREAARLLSVSPRHLFNLRKQGLVPYVNLGGRVLYPRQELATWIAEQVATTTRDTKAGGTDQENTPR